MNYLDPNCVLSVLDKAIVHEIKKVQKSRDIVPLNCAVRAAPARAAPVLPPNSFHMQTLKRNPHPKHGFFLTCTLCETFICERSRHFRLTFVSVPAMSSTTSSLRVTIECRAMCSSTLKFDSRMGWILFWKSIKFNENILHVCNFTPTCIQHF